MEHKKIYKIGLFLINVFCIILGGCKEDKGIFETTPSAGIFLTPSKTGVILEDATVVLSSTPVNLNFGVALYREAASDVLVELGIDQSLIEEFNRKNSTSYSPMPEGAARLSQEQLTIKKGNRSDEPIQIVLNTGLLAENTTYLLPLRIKKATGGGIELDEATTIRYYAIKGQLANIAKGKKTQQSTTNGSATSDKGVDGNVNGALSGGSVTHTLEGLAEQWWEVDLGGVSSRIKQVNLYNRTDCCGIRLSNYYIFVSDVPFTGTSVSSSLSQSGVTAFFQAGQAGSPSIIPVERTGRYVRVQLSQGTLPLAIAELEVLGL